MGQQAAGEISNIFFMHFSKSRYLLCGSDAPEKSNAITEAREQQGGKDKVFRCSHSRMKENMLSSAKCFAFTFFHQGVADKRIHYQGLTPTGHQRSH